MKEKKSNHEIIIENFLKINYTIANTLTIMYTIHNLQTKGADTNNEKHVVSNFIKKKEKKEHVISMQFLK